MNGALRLVGILAWPEMLAVFGLSGTPERLPGVLTGGARAGIDRDGWPRLEPGRGHIDAVRVVPNAALIRYCAVMGLGARDGCVGLGDGGAVGPPCVGLAAEIARQILAAPPDQSPDQIARRLPMMGVWAASVLRGAKCAPTGGGLVAPRGPDAVQMVATAEPFAGYFAVQVAHLRHRTHAGGMTPVLRRETFLSGDAVVVLPWDPVRDRVLLIEQFRMAPFLRRDPWPWLLETVAGRVDAGETVEQAALREAREEAGLVLTRLFPAINCYPSPGAFAEYLYLYVGIADLPDGIAGVHGLESEDEDIRGHVIGRPDLTRMALQGQLSNGPLATLALWLELQAGKLHAQLEG